MFTNWIHAHNRSILFTLVALTIGGIASSVSLPVALFPQVHFPRVVVNIDSGDRTAERMATEVTYPAEEAVRSVPGVLNIRSQTSRGSSEISVNFDWKEDMTAAMLQVESSVNQAVVSMPAGTTFTVRRMDPTVFPVICYSLTSDTRGGVELYDLAQYQLRPALTSVGGVAKVGVQGGGVEEYRVDADPAKLDRLGLTLSDVAGALSAANVVTAVGRLEDHDKLYLIVTNTSFADMRQIEGTVLRSDASGAIRVGDVAKVYKSAAPQWVRVTADGHDAVLLQIFQQPAGNTVEIAKAVKQRLADLVGRSLIPKDVKLANWYDQSELIVSSASSVRDAILVGVVLAAVILLVFLRNFKTMLIAAVIVPSVLAMTILVLYVLDMSFNIMTLGGMAAAVGLIIDDAIVIEEHIIRRVRGGGRAKGGTPQGGKVGPPENMGEAGGPRGDMGERVRLAAAEFSVPLAGSSASTIIIFAPLAFLSGVTGAFFKVLSLTMAASLVVSFLAAYLVAPLMASKLLKQKDADQKETGRLAAWFNRRYAAMMAPLLRHSWMVLVLMAPVVAIGYIAYERTGSGFMPKMDEGGFVLDYLSKPGTSLAETDRLLKQVEAILHETPEVQTYSRRTGIQLGGWVSEANQGDFFVRLKPTPRRPIEEVMDEVRDKIEHSVPGLDVELAQLMEDMIGDLTAVPQPIEIKLYSDDAKVLNALGPKVAKAIGQVPGVVDVKNGVVIAGDALDINVNREKAALEGMDPDSVTKAMRAYLTGVVTTQVQRGPKMVGVRLWVGQENRATTGALPGILLRSPDGHLFPLGRVATIKSITGQAEITRDDLKRMAAVTGRISGRDLGSTVRDVRKALSESGLIPPGLYYSLGGLYEQQQVAFRGLVMVLVGATALVFVLLLFLYESFRVAAAMLMIPIISTAAVFVGLWLTGIELNITSMMGLTMIVGIATEASIFYYSEYRQVENEEGLQYPPLVQAGVNRMRPILMMKLAAICALLPLAMGWGQGAAMQQPLAVAIIAGLIIQLPLTLIALPALLRMMGEGKTRRHADAETRR